MKKNLIRVLAMVMALAMVVSLAACGNDGKSSSTAGSDKTSSTAGTDSSSSSESASEGTTAAEDGKFATVKAFLDDPATKEQLDAALEQMTGGDDSMDVSLEGSDDTLTYIFKYSDDTLADADVDALAAALEEGMDAQASVFENIASQVGSVVSVENVKVVVTYAKADGTEIYSREFAAK